jgi:hypothetical protein
MAAITLSTGVKVTMREPKVRDMKVVSGIENDVEKEIALVKNLTGMAAEEIEELNMKDYALLQKGLSDFLS